MYVAIQTLPAGQRPCKHPLQAIHYVGQSHVVTTINGTPGNDSSDDYWTRGYSGPTTDAERATAHDALASWKTLGCQGVINPNSEFWQ